MTTKLALYNEALTQYLGERKLVDLTENREPRRVLDDVWDQEVVRRCLERGQWRFAQRVSLLAFDPGVTPTFGYRRAFSKPTDLVRLTKFCSDEYLQTPITSYTDEAGYWFTDYEAIYISYVSDDAAYGGDLSLWPESFTEYVACYMAYKASRRLTQSKTSTDDLREECKQKLSIATSNDAMTGPTVFPPSGVWVNARTGGPLNFDRRPKGSLYG